MTDPGHYDVFLSYASADKATADLVDESFRRAGLDVFNPRTVESEADLYDIFWRALAESAALVAIVSSNHALASSIAVEIGAAAAWHKPIYIVHTATGAIKLPSYLQKYQTYPISRIDDIAHDIRRGLEVLSNDERAILVQVYQDLGIPTDKLLREPATTELLSAAFNDAASRTVAGERLLWELIRLRKTGALPPLRRVAQHHRSA